MAALRNIPFDASTMKIVLCKECKGTGMVIDDGDALSSRGHTCSVCRGYGRIVQQAIKTSFTFDEFDELREWKQEEDDSCDDGDAGDEE